MVKASLVSTDIENGKRMLDALDDSNVKISVALWLYLSEYEDWRLAISSRELDALDLRDAIGAVNRAAKQAGMAVWRVPTFIIHPMNHPLTRGLRRTFSRTSDVEGMRLGGHVIDKQFIEDAYVYRIR